MSVALHAILLAMRFVMPQPSLFKPPDSPLEIILVNAKSADRPVKPTAIAQADLNGGGENDAGRATSFLPRSVEVADGDVVRQTQAAMQQIGDGAATSRHGRRFGRGGRARGAEAGRRERHRTDAPTPRRR